MCGVAGIFAYDESAPPVDREELLRTREGMFKRGPDGAGMWLSDDGRVGLAHRRLAIIDPTDTGAQPMWNAERTLCVTFNGEIYNYRALRSGLEGKGYRFLSNSDTEVLLHLYAELGSDMVGTLRGMYAFAIWDARKQLLFLARDAFGVKPLYYADDGKSFRFASQVKALLKGGAVGAAPDSAGSVGFLLWGSVPEPFTLYRDIKALPAGSFLVLRRHGRFSITNHFSVREELVRAQDDAVPFQINMREALGSALRDSVRHHLVSDVPVAVFLSAGIDSSLVTSLATELSRDPLRTLTLGFREYRGSIHDEVPVAETTAARCGTRHETHWIDRTRFEEELPAILEAMDQPSIDGVNTYFVCREAARAGMKVALTGLGGDELFGGYPSFREVPKLAFGLTAGRLVPSLGRALRSILNPAISLLTSPKYAGLVEYGSSVQGAYLLRRALYMPWELDHVLDPVAVHTGLERLQTIPSLAETARGIREDYAKVAALELSWYMRSQLLRDADWAGKAHSIEVRVPLVDVPLFRAISPWLVSAAPPTKQDAAAVPRPALGADITGRPKSGFSIPVRQWTPGRHDSRQTAARGLRGWARRVLPAQPRQFRVLALVTDAYGGCGGIAKFNRDLLSALARMPECAEVVAVPRLMPEDPGVIPEHVRFCTGAVGGKRRFIRAALAEALGGPFDLVIAGHINLTPIAAAIAVLKRAATTLVIHGIDAWTPHANPLVISSAARMDRVIAVSGVTQERFTSWAAVPPERCRVLPNCVDLGRYAPGPKPQELAARLGLDGRTVIMTLGRLASKERSKGFDEVIEALPALARDIPDIAYLICGDGPDRPRLEDKARSLGVANRVVFAGYVPETSKADYYRLADAYVMPSRGEGFGIVFLEALACGIPAMGSAVDGSREALQDGRLGVLVHPDDPAEVMSGIRETLSTPRGVSRDLAEFSNESFNHLLASIVNEVWASHRHGEIYGGVAHESPRG